MQITRKLRNRLLAAALFAMTLASAPRTAHATSKEIIELQTQVQQLLDMVQRLQSTLDTRLSVVQSLAQQTADNANQVTAAMNALQQKINAQNDALGGKLDTTSGQIQSLNDSVDELKSRVAKLDKSLQEMQTQLQNIQTPPQTGRLASPERRRPPEAWQHQHRKLRRSRKHSRPACGITTPPSTMCPRASSRTCFTIILWTTWPAQRSSTWARSPTGSRIMPTQ